MKCLHLALAGLLLCSCSGKLVRAGGYEDVSLGPVSLRLPAQFKAVKHAPPPNDPLDGNHWAVTHAFAFREAPDGATASLLVVSRVADAQSLSHAQLLYESASARSPDARWRSANRLDWKQDRVSPSLSYSTAALAVVPKGAAVYTMSDRETLLEAVLIGDNEALPPAVARQVLSDLRGNYRVVAPLEERFSLANSETKKNADARRKSYLALLEALQREELDYTPTPRVVVFNRNLAGQFWWPMFDRSGVPAHFAIAARLGKVLRNDETSWRTVATVEPRIRVVSVGGDLGKAWRWTLLAGDAEIGPRTQALLQDSGWLGAAIGGGQQGFATLEFPFDKPIPELSRWLDAVESLAKRAEADGLVEKEPR